jgi:hypothetical protein
MIVFSYPLDGEDVKNLFEKFLLLMPMLLWGITLPSCAKNRPTKYAKKKVDLDAPNPVICSAAFSRYASF